VDITESKPKVSTDQCTFTITQFQFVKWPENGVPRSTTEVLQVANLVQQVQMNTGNKPIVVMCKYVALSVLTRFCSLFQSHYFFSDGVGRTGTFIVTHAEMERMKAESVVDLFQFIKAARVQRAGLVSSKVCIRLTMLLFIIVLARN